MYGLEHSEALARGEALLRERFAPKELRKGVVEEACVECGAVFLRYSGRRRLRCPTCAGMRMVEANRSVRDKAGPIYEKTVRKQLRYWRGEAKRLGIRA